MPKSESARRLKAFRRLRPVVNWQGIPAVAAACIALALPLGNLLYILMVFCLGTIAALLGSLYIDHEIKQLERLQ